MLNEHTNLHNCPEILSRGWDDKNERRFANAAQDYLDCGGTAQRMMEIISMIINDGFVSVAGRVLRKHQEEIGTENHPSPRLILENRLSEDKKIIESGVRIGLLNMITPNGKRLHDCNKADCYKLGGFYTRIAERLKSKQLVGDVISEGELRNILNKEG